MSGFRIDVSYTQFSVFDPKIAKPFNDWSNQHVAQGFAWRPGSVSFGTLEHEGELRLMVILSSRLNESISIAERIIAVPFTVPEHGKVELGSIGGGVEVDIHTGEYELIFEHGREQTKGMWANLYFYKVYEPIEPKIIRADPELSPPPHEFLMAAEPA